MSGHSKWATIKRDKESNDSKKGAIFTKISKDITAAAKHAGGDIGLNTLLAAAVNKAKNANMPNNKIQKAIDKGLGISKSGLTIASLIYEAYGPLDVGLIIDVSTDNRNRTLSEIKLILDRNGGRFVEGGAVVWLFDSKGFIRLNFETLDEEKERLSLKWNTDKEEKRLSLSNWQEIQLEIMDIEGLLDIEEDDQGVSIYTTPDSLGKIKMYFDANNFLVEDSDILKLPKNPLDVPEDVKIRIFDLVTKLKDNDDVENVWTALL